MKRRDALKRAAGAGAALVAAGLGGRSRGQENAVTPPTRTEATPDARALARTLPRWRGFNLLEKFNVRRNEPFRETDFQWMADWGFDFVRLPMDYRCWTREADPYAYDAKVLAQIDDVVALGRRYGVHVSLNLHRAPGYTVARPPEALDLWHDAEAQKRFNAQWAMFATRYRGVPAAQLSFDLVNEPAKVGSAIYAPVARKAVEAIRAEDPERLVISDGLRWGREPIHELADLGIAQSTRGYDPMGVSHYKASWVGGEAWPEPTWPLARGETVYDKAWLREDRIEPWKRLEAKGVGVHVGEWGAFKHTPHKVVLAWMRDCLELWREAGWGWALWNLRGAFGVVDSGRDDVRYEAFQGHHLDRTMLDLLRAF